MRHTGKKLAALSLLALALLLLLPGSKVRAASLEQTDATRTSITVQWEPVDNATRYEVYVGESSDTAVLYKAYSDQATQAKITGLKAGTQYYVKLQYTYQAARGSLYEGSVTSDAGTLPGKVSGLKQESWYSFTRNFYAAWDRQTGVDGYEYVVCQNNGKTFTSGKTSHAYGNHVWVDGISDAKIYVMRVRAYKTFNGRTYYGGWSDKAYFFTQPQIREVTAGDGSLTVCWDRVSGATGYNVYVSTRPKKGYRKVKSVGKDKTKVTIRQLNGKKIRKKTTYYVYVQTVKKTSGGKYKSRRQYYWNSKDGSYRYF